jgi:hypothetical protein
VWVSGNPQSAAYEGRGYLRFVFALWFIVRTIWTSQTYDVIDYYFPFNTILSTVWWCPCYVTAVYVNNWSWHVHGSHSVCLLKPGVTLELWPLGPKQWNASWRPSQVPNLVQEARLADAGYQFLTHLCANHPRPTHCFDDAILFEAAPPVLPDLWWDHCCRC